MDIKNIKVDPDRIEQGAWVGEKYETPIPDMGDLCLQVRGINNASWRRLQARLIAAVPRAKRLSGKIDLDEMDRINAMLLRDCGLTGWENMAEDGVTVEYSKEAAERFLTDPVYGAFRDAVMWACAVVGNGGADQVKVDAKN